MTRTMKERIGNTRGKGLGGRTVREFETDLYTLFYLKQRTNKVLLAQGTLFNLVTIYCYC